MRILRDYSSCPPACQGATVAIGNFDGVHLGHQAILSRCIESAHASGTPAAMMTFEPHPREFFSRDKARLRIESFRRKAELLRDKGIDLLFVVRFNRRFAALAAEDFIGDILHRDLKAQHVITGYNFAFGKNRQGTTATLDEAAGRLGFTYTACPPVLDAAGQAISSSAIRQALTNGDVRRAGALLGRPYTIEGRVRNGDRRGRMLGYPTANISLASLYKPRFGIYAVRMALDGVWHDAVASLGVRPTFGAGEALLEVHGFDMDADLYGRRISVEFADFIRDEARFDDVEALRRQMASDCRQARLLLQRKAG